LRVGCLRECGNCPEQLASDQQAGVRGSDRPQIRRGTRRGVVIAARGSLQPTTTTGGASPSPAEGAPRSRRGKGHEMVHHGKRHGRSLKSFRGGRPGGIWRWVPGVPRPLRHRRAGKRASLHGDCGFSGKIWSRRRDPLGIGGEPRTPHPPLCGGQRGAWDLGNTACQFIAPWDSGDTSGAQETNRSSRGVWGVTRFSQLRRGGLSSIFRAKQDGSGGVIVWGGDPHLEGRGVIEASRPPK